ncbi:MFS transporter [Streptomyces sp. HNM0575]|uniref:MFS transporter n=1 Tax=Streptomyces sp. HNM0575 TaxID=2716338 RepID=UPI00145F80F6|nr:MFS transporter [Streptomyces sp. HNM0575]NLU76225.1 MFS transporter [Streptomyces sp. HNM0575]
MVTAASDASDASDAAPLLRLWSAVLCGYLALGATLQALPSYVVRHFHAGTLAAGTTVGIAFLATACARPFAGRLADAGHARPVVVTGGTLAALGGAGHLLAPGLVSLLLARLVMGAGEAALFSGALPWVLGRAAPERRGRVAGWFGLSMWSGLALGPVVAVGLHRGLGFSGVWWGVVLLGAAAAALVLTTRGASGAGDGLAPLPRGFRDIVPRGAPLPGLTLGLSSWGYGTVTALLVLYLRHEDLGGDGVALALFASGFLLVRALGSPLVDRYGGAAVAIGSLGAEAAGLALIAGVGAEGPALLGAAVAGAGVGLMYPATVATTLRRAGALRPGTAVGVMTSFWDLGIMVASPFAGLIAAGGGYRPAFAVAVAVSLLGLGIVALRLRTAGPVAGTRRPARDTGGGTGPGDRADAEAGRQRS